jgi:hypothetical protein
VEKIGDVSEKKESEKKVAKPIAEKSTKDESFDIPVSILIETGVAYRTSMRKKFI